jgi:hypothetical protein
MKSLLTSLLLIVCTFGNVTVTQAQQSFNPKSAHYIWPTEASPYLSSTFAETRSAHFHAALDIKTWGQRGYKVFATRKGTIDRIAIGPKGYGKVIYLKHDDGSYSVYAHLLSFNNQLQELIDSIRLQENYKFEIQRFLGWRNITVEQGDLLGYTGASGIGPPHLHFELRTPTHKPFNPLLTNLSVEDNIAPQIRGISIEPLSYLSSIEGKNAIYTRKIRTQEESYELGTIEVTGPVGLGVNVFDQANDVNNAYAVYKLSLSLNGQPLFTTRADSFSYGETNQMILDRVYPLLNKNKGSYQRMYLADGNTLPFYENVLGEGILDLPPGNHPLTIRATDFNGNSSEVSLQLNVRDKKDSHTQLKKKINNKKSSPSLSPHRWNWFSNWLTLTTEEFQQLTIASADSTQFANHRNGIAIDLMKNESQFINIPGTGPVTFRRIEPGSFTFIGSDDQQHFVFFPRRTFYDTVSAAMAAQKNTFDSLTADIIPEAYPLRDSYTFYVSRDSSLTDTTSLSFYKIDRFDEDEEWELIPTTFTENYIIGEAESLGTFISRRDTTPPQLSNPRLRQRPDDQWVINIEVTDDLSGIEYQKTTIFVNGIQGIAEYEPEDNRLVYYHPDFKPTDSMKIEITCLL